MRKTGEGDRFVFFYTLGSFVPFILQTRALFPSKKSCSKVEPFQIYGHMLTREELVFNRIN